MSITISHETGGSRVRIEDELTIYTAGAAHAALRDAMAAGGRVAIDLDGVTAIDTSGLQLLLAVRKEGLMQGREPSFTRPNPVVMDCLTLMKLADLFPFDAPAAGADPVQGKRHG